MSLLEIMYAGQAFSPVTSLSQAISSTDTIIVVEDASIFLPPPNYLVIGAEENGEVIRYSEIVGNSLSGCIRGVEGEAKAHESGQAIARNWTNKDYQTLINNVTTLNESKADKETTYSKTESDTALGLKADKETTYNKTESDTALDLKADKASTYGKTDVYNKSEADTALDLKADKASTYGKTDLYNKTESDGKYFLKTTGDTHDANVANPHAVTKAQVGLGSVNNWGASSSVSSTSNTQYATSGAAKTAYDRGTGGITAAGTKMPIAGGTFTGNVITNGAQNPATRGIRNITCSTGGPSGGNNGDVWFKYK